MNSKILSAFIASIILSVGIVFAQSAAWWNIAPIFDNAGNPIDNATVVIPTTNSNQTYSNSYNSNNEISTLAPLVMTVQGDNDSNSIRDDVDSVINNIVRQNNLNSQQRRAVEQLARSYQYVLMLSPSTPEAAYQASIRDTAAIRCAELRIPPSFLDGITLEIERATLNNQLRNETYNVYINLIEDYSQAAPVTATCEDEFSSSVTSSNSSQVINYTNVNTNSNTNSNSIVSTNQSGRGLPCLILNEFMSPGLQSSQVIKLQTFLVMSGYMYVWPTGYFGSNTAEALNSFQNRYGIDSRNPWAGPSTRAKIAEITCNGSSQAIASARNGYTPSRGNSNVTSNSKSSSAAISSKSNTGYTETRTVKISTTTTEVVIPATNSSDVYSDQSSIGILSATSGTFDTSLSNVNVLYFTVKADTIRDELFICFQSVGASNCNNTNNYTLVRDRYNPLSYDSVSSSGKWIFNIYYNRDNALANGGKIYFRNGLGNVPVVYTVNVR